MNGLDGAVRTKISQAVGPGSNLCRAKNFYESTDICPKFELFRCHSGWTMGI